MGQIHYKDIYNDRRDKWKEATSEGNRKFDQLFAGQYSENNHFIYELLQNADDVKATFITFVYQGNRLTVYHDGDPFTEAHVSGICSILDSTKADDPQAIGHFGFGFKSVFKYTDRPEVYSDQEAFAIERYLLPVEIPLGNFPRDCQYRMGNEIVRPFEGQAHCTRFILPFKAGLESAGIDPKDIPKKLAGLETEILLFLRHVETLIWIDETTGDYGEYKRVPDKKLSEAQASSPGQIWICRKTRSVNDGKTQSEDSRFLIYEDMVSTKEMASAHVKIAFRFQKSAISPIDDARVWVFFPTTDKSGLKFLVHGTYQTPISRERLIVDSTFNTELQHRTEDLVVKALPDLCARDLITQPFLREVLLPSFNATFFPQLRKKITAVFQRKALLPTSEKGIFLRPDELRLPVPHEMIKAISSRQIVSMGGPDLHFAAFNDVNSTSGAEYYRWLKNDLGVKLWTISDFSDLITEENAERFDGVTSVLIPLSEIFSDCYGRTDYSIDLRYSFDAAQEKLKQTVMIPNRAGGLSAAWVNDKENIFFADISKRTGKIYVSLDKIEEEKREAVTLFLENQLEVSTYSHEKYVEMHIVPKYEKRPISVSDEEHIRDLKQMEKCSHLVSFCTIIRAKDRSGNCSYKSPRDDALYFETDDDGYSIKNYLEGLSEEYYFVDTEFYESHGVTRKELYSFGISGSILEGESETRGVYSTGRPGAPPEWNTSGDFRWKLSIKGLNDALIYIAQNPDTANAKEKSKVIFHILQKNLHKLIGTVYIGGSIEPNKNNEPAKIITQLCPKGYCDYEKYRWVEWRGKWLYTKSGKLVSQSEITKRELDTGLYGSVSLDSQLYDLLGFKKDEVDMFEDTLKEYDRLPREKQEAYFESALFLKYGMTPEKLDRILTAKASASSFEFPWQPVRNLDRLRRHVAEQFACSSPVRYKILPRSIRVTSNDGKSYLRDLYETDGQYACQLCHRPFPPSEIESVQISERAERELDQINLCLCANCAMEYRKIRRGALESQILAWDETRPQSGPVELPIDKNGQFLWFSPVHLAEVKLLLQLLKDEDTSQSSSEDCN